MCKCKCTGEMGIMRTAYARIVNFCIQSGWSKRSGCYDFKAMSVATVALKASIGGCKHTWRASWRFRGNADGAPMQGTSVTCSTFEYAYAVIMYLMGN